MRTLVALVLVFWFAIAPAASYAQQAAPAPAMPQMAGVPSGKALAVGIGILAGALIATTPMTLRGITLLGAVTGGILASWWYDERTATLMLDQTKKVP